MNRSHAIATVQLCLALAVGRLAADVADGAESSPTVGAPTIASDADGKFDQARALLPHGGRPGDPAKSFALMKEAAAAGHADAIGALGHYHANGIGTPKDELQAVRCFREGAEHGSAKAMLNLGLMLCQGKGVVADPAAGKNWIRKAAETGLPEANLEWAEVLYHGKFTGQAAQAEALPYYRRAAEAGFAGAWNTLGVMYENGTGVTVDTKQATRCFQQAAEAGHLNGQMNYGRMLNPEHGNRDTRVEAMAWLMIAADRGSVPAKKLLDPIRIAGAADELSAATSMAAKLRMEMRKRRSPGSK